MPKVIDDRAKRAAPEVWSKVARAVGGGERAVVYGGVAVEFWVECRVPSRDIDILMNPGMDLQEMKKRLERQGFRNVSGYYSFFSMRHVVASGPIEVQIVTDFGPGGLFSRFPKLDKGRFLDHSEMRSDGEQGIRVLSTGALLLTKWHGYMDRRKHKGGRRDLDDIKRILAGHYDGSPDRFLADEREVIMEVLGAKKRSAAFAAFMGELGSINSAAGEALRR